MHRRHSLHAILGCALLMASSFAVGCSSGGGVQPVSQMRYVDSQIWEKQLQASLGAGLPTVNVAFAGKDATMSNMPERLEKWLFVINERDDGNVRFEPDPGFAAPKSPIGLVFTVGMQAWRLFSEYAHYAPAANYNALVFYHPTEAYLTKVVFVRKAGADS